MKEGEERVKEEGREERKGWRRERKGGREGGGESRNGNSKLSTASYRAVSLTAKRSTLSTILAQSISLKGWRELRAVGMIHCWKITRFTFRMNSYIIKCVCVCVCVCMCVG